MQESARGTGGKKWTNHKDIWNERESMREIVERWSCWLETKVTGRTVADQQFFLSLSFLCLSRTWIGFVFNKSLEWWSTGWRGPVGCLKLQVIFCKRATSFRALLRKMTYEDKAPYVSTPPCRLGEDWVSVNYLMRTLSTNRHIHTCTYIYVWIHYKSSSVVTKVTGRTVGRSPGKRYTSGSQICTEFRKVTHEQKGKHPDHKFALQVQLCRLSCLSGAKVRNVTFEKCHLWISFLYPVQIFFYRKKFFFFNTHI